MYFHARYPIKVQVGSSEFIVGENLVPRHPDTRYPAPTTYLPTYTEVSRYLSFSAGTEHQWMPIGCLDPAGTQFSAPPNIVPPTLRLQL